MFASETGTKRFGDVETAGGAIDGAPLRRRPTPPPQIFIARVANG